MSSKLIYGKFNFADNDIVKGTNITLANGMVGNELSVDTLELGLVCDGTGKSTLALQTSDGKLVQLSNGNDVVIGITQEELISMLYGTELALYHDERLLGKFYHTVTQRTGKDVLSVSAVSAMGMLDSIYHKGGVYAGVDIKDLLDELMANYDYSISDEVAEAKIYGWLPYATCRSNLHQVLFAVGACITKDSNGDAYIDYMKAGNEPTIPTSHTFSGGKVSYNAKATEINVTEHAYYSLDSDDTVVLLDNTLTSYAEHLLVTFKEPCHDLTATGLTIDESGDNYAIVSGNGVLKGKKYTHTQQIIEIRTGISGEPKTVSVANCTLVSAVNSQNVAKRLAGYYTEAMTVETDILIDEEAPVQTAHGYQFTDAYNDTRKGFAKSIGLKVSGILRGRVQFDTGWTPTNYGNNFTRYTEVTTDGTFTVPEDCEIIRLTLIQGGAGGQAGFNGGKGADANGLSQVSGGTGGQGGKAGTNGKVYTIDIPVAAGQVVSMSVGQGGTAGTSNGELGTAGTHSTATIGSTTYSSDSGLVSKTGIQNVITSEVYALQGEDGTKGGDGAGWQMENYSAFTRRRAEDVTYNGTTWLGGEGGGVASSGNYRDFHGAGGGAAVGSNGGDGGNGDLTYDRGGAGGTGGNGNSAVYVDMFGYGGNAGHGGGGGGIGGPSLKKIDGSWTDYGTDGTGGNGGTGGAGANGGQGAIIIYY